MRQLGENIWLLQLPLRLAGCQLGRNVTIIRLPSDQLVIHSTGPFADGQLAAMNALGTPAWVVDATLFHDTCAKAGRAAFPDLPYLVPPGFSDSLKTTPLLPPPREWDRELDVIALEGMPRVREHVFFHRRSATLIVADLLFNLAPTGWTRLFMRVFAGMQSYPDMSRFFRFLIKDREAFRTSINQLRELPFDRIVVAHGDPIETNARQAFDSTLSAYGF